MEILAQIRSKYNTPIELYKAYLNLAIAHIEHGDYRSALGDLDQAGLKGTKESLDPESWEITFLKGLAYEKTNEPVKAIKEYLSSAKLATTYKVSLYGRAQRLLSESTAESISRVVHKHELEAVVDDADMATAIQQELPDVFFRREDVINPFNLKGITIEDKVQLLVFLARIIIDSRRSEIELAEKMLKKAADISQQNPFVNEGLGDVYQLLRSTSEDPAAYYLTALAEMSAEPDRFVSVLTKLIDFYTLHSRFNEATGKLSDIISKTTDRIIKWKARLLLLEVNYRDPAQRDDECYQSIRDAAPMLIEELKSTDLESDFKVEAHLSVLLLLGKAQVALRDYDNAKATVDEAVELQNSHKNFLLLKAQILIESGSDVNGAKALLSLGVDDVKKDLTGFEDFIRAKRHDDIFAQISLGFVYVAVGRPIEEIKKQAELLAHLKLTSADAWLPDIALPILLGDMALLSNNIHEAAINYYEVAVRLAVNKKYKEACALFATVDGYAEVKKNTPEFEYFYFEYANALYSDSILEVPPYRDKEKLHDAYTTWNKNEKREISDPAKYWYFEVIGFTQTSLAEFYTGNDSIEFNWRALLNKECAVILKSSAHSLACLAHGYRLLEFDYAPKPIIRAALEEWSNYAFALEEAVILSLNSGNSADAKRYMSMVADDVKKTIYYKQWGTFLQYYEKEYDQALTTLLQLVKDDPNDTWSLDLITCCYWRKGNVEESMKFARQYVAKKATEGEQSDPTTITWSECLAAKYEMIDRHVQKIIKFGKPQLSPFTNIIFFALTYKPVKEARELFDYFDKWVFNIRLVNDLIADIDVYARLSKEFFPNRKITDSELNSVFQNWIPRVEKKKADLLRKEPEPFRELEYQRDRLSAPEGSAIWLASAVAQARILMESREFERAYNKYSGLLKYEKEFPLAKLAVKQVTDQILREAEDLVRGGDTQKADEKLRFLSESISIFPERYHAIDLLIALARHERVNAANILGDAIDRFAKAGDPMTFCSTLVDNMPSPAEYWLMTDIVKEQDDGKYDWLVNEISYALQKYWTNISGTQPTTPDFFSTPIALKVSSHLWPLGDILIKNYIPAMRQRIQEQYSLPIPGVRIWEDKFSSQNCTILINEVAIESFEVPENNPYPTIIERLEHQVVRRLDQFYDIQATEIYLQEAREADETLGDIQDSILLDNKKMIELNKVLRWLLKDHVSIENKSTIIKAFNNTWAGMETASIVNEIRKSVKAKLPGNELTRATIRLPESTEDIFKSNILTKEGKTFLAMNVKVRNILYANIDGLVGSYSKEYIVLEVSGSEIRPHVQAFINSEFLDSDLPVIARDELSYQSVQKPAVK